MAIRPILSSLSRHRIAAGLIVLEVALSFAIVCNALHLIAQRIERLRADSGLAESELIHLSLRGVARIEQPDALTARDLEALRALPGVKAAAVTNQVIYGDNSNSSGINNQPENRGTRVVAANYSGDQHFIPSHGLKLLAGRNFLPEEVQKDSELSRDPALRVPALIVNRELAEALFPGRSAVGQTVWVFGGQPSTIVGVVERLSHPYPGPGSGPHAFIAPVLENFRGGSYVLRVEAGRREALLQQAAATIRRIDARRFIGSAQTLSEMRERYYAEDRAMTGLLAGVCLALLAVTAFGIVGLASFWVAQRTRMIGIRRALGATQAQIRQYFQLENLLLCGMGVVLGLLGAIGLSQLIVRHQAATALPWAYLPLGALLLLALGQLAVLAPARRAAALPAASAMRD